MTFWRGEAMVWWFSPRTGSRRAYHRGPMPMSQTAAHLVPLIVLGTVEEAQVAGFVIACKAGDCGDAEQRLTKPRGRWQRGGKVRR